MTEPEGIDGSQLALAYKRGWEDCQHLLNPKRSWTEGWRMRGEVDAWRPLAAYFGALIITSAFDGVAHRRGSPADPHLFFAISPDGVTGAVAITLSFAVSVCLIFYGFRKV